MTPGMLSQSNNQTTACESLVWQQIIVRLCIMSHRRTLCCAVLACVCGRLTLNNPTLSAETSSWSN